MLAIPSLCFNGTGCVSSSKRPLSCWQEGSMGNSLLPDTPAPSLFVPSSVCTCMTLNVSPCETGDLRMPGWSSGDAFCGHSPLSVHLHSNPQAPWVSEEPQGTCEGTRSSHMRSLVAGDNDSGLPPLPPPPAMPGPAWPQGAGDTSSRPRSSLTSLSPNCARLYLLTW